jgi:DNA polymerase-3 subunit gamma/tau
MVLPVTGFLCSIRPLRSAKATLPVMTYGPCWACQIKAGSWTCFKAIASGQPEEALSLFDALYADGADPAGVIRSLAEFVHDLTRLHVTRGKADLGPGEANREAIMELGRGLSMPQLSRFWQAALAGLSEVQSAFQPSMAAEMVVMRLCYLAQMPDPSSLITQMRNAGASGGISPGDPGPREAPGDQSPRVTLAPTGAPVSASDSAPQAPLSAPNLNT